MLYNCIRNRKQYTWKLVLSVVILPVVSPCRHPCNCCANVYAKARTSQSKDLGVCVRWVGGNKCWKPPLYPSDDIRIRTTYVVYISRSKVHRCSLRLFCLCVFDVNLMSTDGDSFHDVIISDCFTLHTAVCTTLTTLLDEFVCSFYLDVDYNVLEINDTVRDKLRRIVLITECVDGLNL